MIGKICKKICKIICEICKTICRIWAQKVAETGPEVPEQHDDIVALACRQYSNYAT